MFAAVLTLVSAAYALGRHERGRRSVYALMVGIVAMVTLAVLLDPNDIFFPVTFFWIVPWLAGRTIRNHTILEYEIPKYEGDLGLPNLYVPLPRAAVDGKVEMLMKCFPSQSARAWFSEDLFRGNQRVRWVECNAPSGFAEAFYARKLVI